MKLYFTLPCYGTCDELSKQLVPASTVLILTASRLNSVFVTLGKINTWSLVLEFHCVIIQVHVGLQITCLLLCLALGHLCLLSSAWQWSTAAGFWSIMGKEVTSQYIGCFFFGQFNCMSGLRQQCNVLCIFKISLLAFCVSILNNYWSYLVVPFTFDGFLAHQQIFSSFFHVEYGFTTCNKQFKILEW